MNNKININNDYILRKNKIIENSNINISENTKNFQEILKKIETKDELKFSKHASSRLEARNINLTTAEVSRINDAVSKAKSKGVKEALIMMDNKVFIASVNNRTIITAADSNELKENVFTNIDGAVII